MQKEISILLRSNDIITLDARPEVNKLHIDILDAMGNEQTALLIGRAEILELIQSLQEILKLY